MALEKVLALDATGVIEKSINTGGGGPVTEYSGDCDSLTTSGDYNATNAAINRPTTDTNGYFIKVFTRAAAPQILQVANPNAEAAVIAGVALEYYRWFDGTTWSIWKSVSADDGVTAANICDLAMDGATLINVMREWYYKPSSGVAKLIAHGKTGASTLAYISKGTLDALSASTSGTGSSVVTTIGAFLVSTGTTATGYAYAYGGVIFGPVNAGSPYNIVLPTAGIGSKLAASVNIDVDALSDATNTYEARITLLGEGPLAAAAMVATTPGFSVSYTHSVNSGNFVIQYRGADGTLKTVNTAVAPGVGLANSKRIIIKAHRSAAGVATVTISIAGTVYTITDSAFNTDSSYFTAVIGSRMLKSVGTTARVLNVRSPAVARNLI
jgi:hypothetical protein